MDAKAELDKDIVYGPMTVAVAVKKEGRPWAKMNVEHAKNGQKVYKLVTEKTTTDVEVVPQKLAKVNYQGPMYTHKTHLGFQNKELTIQSETTKRGHALAAVNAQYSRRRPSFLDIDTPPHQMRFEVQPYEQEKLAKLVYTNTDGITHNTMASYITGKAIALKSKTTKNSAVVADIDAKLSQPRSEMRIESGLFNAHGYFDPDNNKANLEVRGKRLPLVHATNLNWAREPTLKTSTQIDGKERFQLNAKFADNKAEAAALNDLFEGTLVAVPGQLTVDYKRRDQRRAPRIQATTSVDMTQRQLRADVKWDAERDQNKHLVILAQAQPSTRYDRTHRGLLNIKVIERTHDD